MNEKKVKPPRYFRDLADGHIYKGAVTVAGPGVNEEEVQVAPLDAIVIDRADLPEVTALGDERFEIDGDTYWRHSNIDGLDEIDRDVRRYVAWSLYLREHPPVDEAQVARIAQALAADYDGEPVMGERLRARRLYERGVRFGEASKS